MEESKVKTAEEIKLALDQAYKDAGPNAYFGNGFMSGYEYAKSHITKLEAQVSDLEMALIITKNSRKSHIEKYKSLEARNNQLEDALQSVLNCGVIAGNFSQYVYDVQEIAEQALKPNTDENQTRVQ